MSTQIVYIAVIDDHTMVRKGIVQLVNLMSGYEVLFEASDGKDFIRQLHPTRLPDIALVDISMPGMDGYVTASWIKKNYPLIKILALSTMDAETAILRMVRSGARGYLLKDADPTELAKAFKEILTIGYYYNDLISRKLIRSLGHVAGDASLNEIVSLTEREMEFIGHVCTDKTYLEIAKLMFLSEKTIDGYRDRLFKKLNVSSRVGLVLYAIKNELVKI